MPNLAKIQNPAVTADKLQPTPDHMTNASLLASSSARPAAALRDKGKESMPDRQDHELLASEAVAGVGAAVDDVEARDGHDKPRVTAQL